MRFIVSTSTLLKQLQSVSGALSNSTVLPILENFLFEIKDGNLTISATDLQTSMTTSLTVEAKENGRIAIPSRILLDTLKSLPEQPIAFNIDDTTFAIEINAGDSLFIPKGAIHHHDNHTQSVAKTLIVMTPATIGPAYFREMSTLIKPGVPPHPQQVKEVMLKHGLVPATA